MTGFAQRRGAREEALEAAREAADIDRAVAGRR
jgi:hypothetical protein